MRKTLTIDDDIAVLIKQEHRRTGASFKATVNRLLSLGLMSTQEGAGRKPFEITPRPMGLPPGQSYDCVAELLENLEGPYHR